MQGIGFNSTVRYNQDDGVSEVLIENGNSEGKKSTSKFGRFSAYPTKVKCYIGSAIAAVATGIAVTVGVIIYLTSKSSDSPSKALNVTETEPKLQICSTKPLDLLEQNSSCNLRFSEEELENITRNNPSLQESSIANRTQDLLHHHTQIIKAGISHQCTEELLQSYKDDTLFSIGIIQTSIEDMLDIMPSNIIDGNVENINAKLANDLSRLNEELELMKPRVENLSLDNIQKYSFSKKDDQNLHLIVNDALNNDLNNATVADKFYTDYENALGSSIKSEWLAEIYELRDVGKQFIVNSNTHAPFEKHLDSGIDYILDSIDNIESIESIESIDNQNVITDDTKEAIENIFKIHIFYRHVLDNSIREIQYLPVDIGLTIGVLSSINLHDTFEKCIPDEYLDLYKEKFKKTEHVEQHTEIAHLAFLKELKSAIKIEDKIVKDIKSSSSTPTDINQGYSKLLKIFEKYANNPDRNKENTRQEIKDALEDLSTNAFHKYNSKRVDNDVHYFYAMSLQDDMLERDEAVTSVMAKQMLDTMLCKDDMELASPPNTIQHV